MLSLIKRRRPRVFATGLSKRLTGHFTAPSGTICRSGRTIVFDAEGGRTYRVEGVEWDDTIYIWIEDTYTREIVGGEKP